MPIYEYQCKQCTHQLEAMQKMSDAPLTQCPQCGQESLTKLVSASGFKLTGTGWYETDFKNKKTSGKEPSQVENKSAPVTGSSHSGCGGGGCGSC